MLIECVWICVIEEQFQSRFSITPSKFMEQLTSITQYAWISAVTMAYIGSDGSRKFM